MYFWYGDLIPCMRRIYALLSSVSEVWLVPATQSFRLSQQITKGKVNIILMSIVPFIIFNKQRFFTSIHGHMGAHIGMKYKQKRNAGYRFG